MAALTLTAATLSAPPAPAQQWNSTGSGVPPIVTKAPAAQAQTETAATFDGKFNASLMSNNILLGYTLWNNLPLRFGL